MKLKHKKKKLQRAIGMLLLVATAYASQQVLATELIELGTLGGSTSFARGVSSNGDVVIGDSFTNGDVFIRAFRWSAANGTMTDLGTLGGDSSVAFAVNSTGTVVVGWAIPLLAA
ncbi:hypothetical protein [Herminiimonas arsenitoxidans]|uniref:hypothetical protein n=1 Tax=Herminiimonas arsenitoxidans TaxID=1809410 RepID=UPI00097044CF|nr:hypothetical protein [Herminiimonas arsenitoxidans]